MRLAARPSAGTGNTATPGFPTAISHSSSRETRLRFLSRHFKPFPDRKRATGSRALHGDGRPAPRLPSHPFPRRAWRRVTSAAECSLRRCRAARHRPAPPPSAKAVPSSRRPPPAAAAPRAAPYNERHGTRSRQDGSSAANRQALPAAAILRARGREAQRGGAERDGRRGSTPQNGGRAEGRWAVGAAATRLGLLAAVLLIRKEGGLMRCEMGRNLFLRPKYRLNHRALSHLTQRAHGALFLSQSRPSRGRNGCRALGFPHGG